ncbi:MAG: hypothetical protein ABSH38_01130 [Verrucomicrobiota bacterium]|jgi:hypothetical protein
MLARVLSAALSAILSAKAPPEAAAEAPGSATAEANGIEAFPVEVEVNSGWGIRPWSSSALPDTAVKKSRDQGLIRNPSRRFR